MTIVDLRRVSVSFADGRGLVQALDEVSLSVAAGEMIAIVGPSGSGKSTLLNVMGLMIRATSGAVILDGQAVEGMSSGAAARLRNALVGHVLQEGALSVHETVWDNVCVPAWYQRPRRPRAALRARVEELLDRFGVSDLARSRVQPLSGGEKQRVGLCRALLNEPRLVLADEPTAALDPVNRDIVVQALRTEAGRGAAVVVVTHNESLARQCDRTIRLERGRIVTPDRQLEDQQQP